MGLAELRGTGVFDCDNMTRQTRIERWWDRYILQTPNLFTSNSVINLACSADFQSAATTANRYKIFMSNRRELIVKFLGMICLLLFGQF